MTNLQDLADKLERMAKHTRTHLTPDECNIAAGCVRKVLRDVRRAKEDK
jgi:hypothetical protein